MAYRQTPTTLTPYAHLFRVILFDLNVTRESWQRMMSKYLDNPKHGVLKEHSKRNETVRKLNSALRSPKMTQVGFMKALRFLDVNEAKLSFDWSPDKKAPTLSGAELKWYGTRTTRHQLIGRPHVTYLP